MLTMELRLLVRPLLLSKLVTQHLLRTPERGPAIESGTDRHQHDQPDREIHEEFFRRHETIPLLTLNVLRLTFHGLYRI